MKDQEQARLLFGLSLSERPKWQQFLICSSGFFFGYLVDGVCEEYVYNGLQFSIIGVVMISGALVMDAFLRNLQEAIFTMNSETTQAWASCSQHPYVYVVLIFEAMATFIGQVCVLSLIPIFSAATTAMITTARKAVTLLLSYIIFTKPLTEQHGTGLIPISMGIILKMLPLHDSSPPKQSTRSYTVAKVEKSSYSNNSINVVENEEEEQRPLV